MAKIKFSGSVLLAQSNLDKFRGVAIKTLIVACLEREVLEGRAKKDFSPQALRFEYEEKEAQPILPGEQVEILVSSKENVFGHEEIEIEDVKIIKSHYKSYKELL